MSFESLMRQIQQPKWEPEPEPEKKMDSIGRWRKPRTLAIGTTKCRACGKTFTKSGVGVHFSKCKKRVRDFK